MSENIVDQLRSDGMGERHYVRESRIVLGGLLDRAASEIEQLRVDCNKASIDGAAKERARIIELLSEHREIYAVRHMILNLRNSNDQY